MVNLSRFFSLILLFALCACSGAHVQEVTQLPIVKLSTSGICHDERSASFNRTKNFTPYDSIAAGIDAGGPLPKSVTKQKDNATNEAIEQGRDFVSLYDRGDWPHWLDDDKDCQNSRHEILIQSPLTPATFKTGKE
jgi:hypothetical protein